MFEEEEKDEIDDAVLDGLADDDLGDDLLDDSGLPLTPEPPKETGEFDGEIKEGDDLIGDEDEEIDDYDSFDDHDEL